MLRRFLFPLLLSLIVAAPAAQAQGLLRQLTPTESQAVAKVQGWFDRLDTLTAEFKQTTRDGLASGDFYYARPSGGRRGGLRFNYEEPARHFLTTSGGAVYFWNARLETQSQASVEDTPAWLLLKPNLQLQGDPALLLSDVEFRSNGPIDFIVLTLRQGESQEQAEAGLMRMFFERAPVRLLGWQVENRDGSWTRVELYNTQLGQDIPQETFIFNPPRNRRAGGGE